MLVGVTRGVAEESQLGPGKRALDPCLLVAAHPTRTAQPEQRNRGQCQRTQQQPPQQYIPRGTPSIDPMREIEGVQPNGVRRVLTGHLARLNNPTEVTAPLIDK